MKVLVTGAGAVLGQGIIRSLQSATFPIQVVAADPAANSAGLYWTDKRYLIPMAKDPRFLDAVGRVVRAENPDAICVGTDVELSLFAAQREELEKAWKTHIIVSSPEVVRIADDKFETARFLGSHGFRVPRSCLPGDVDALIQRVGFPLVVKPRVGARAIGVETVHNESALRAAIARASNPVIQECVGTDQDEYTASVLVFDGVARASIVMRRDLRDGNTFRAYVDDYPRLNTMVRSMGEALQPYGPANFQFRVGSDGLPAVFEINARFSGTTPLRHLAGFNEVEMVLRKVVMGEEVLQPPVTRMTILRHWSETVVREHESRPVPFEESR